MALKENYKDDILDVSVNTKRKYRMTENQDGTVSFDDETEYLQEGDSFGASDLNAMAHAINNTSSDAEHTSYDNTTSGLTSDNVQGAIDEINDNLAQTSITVGGITMDTIDEKLNFLCNGGGNDKTVVLLSESGFDYDIVLENNQMPSHSISMYVDSGSGRTASGDNDYITINSLGKGGWAEISIYAKLAGKYAIKGTSENLDTTVTVSANDLIIKCANGAGHSLPIFGSDARTLTIQYLGNN